jgi:hypothetical protein
MGTLSKTRNTPHSRGFRADPPGNSFKYYEVRNNINFGTAVGGGLQNNSRLNQQRYLQFGIKIYF